MSLGGAIVKKENAYVRIYNDILLRLCVGEFPIGSSMPSLSALCEQYNVGKNTIIAALELLKKNGLISTGRGKAATVIYDYRNINKEEIELPSPPVTSLTRFDYYHAVHVIFPPIFARTTISNRDTLKCKLSEIINALPMDVVGSEEYIFLNMRFIKTVNTLIDNHLISYIIKRILQAILLPPALFYGQSETVRMTFLETSNVMRTIYAAVENNSRDRLEIRWRQLFICTQKLLETAIENTDSVEVLPKKEDIIFESADEFKYFLIAFDMQTKILNGEYKTRNSLPTIAEAKNAYHVSAVTIRSAYQVLGEMGFVKTVNGCGTIIEKKLETDDAKQLQMLSGSRIKGYNEAVEFFTITGYEVFTHATNIDYVGLRRSIEDIWNPSKRYSVIILLYYIFNGVGSRAFLAVFKVVVRFLNWGMYMSDVPAFGEMRMINHIKCHEIIDMLEQGEKENAEDMFRELLETLIPNFEKNK